MATNCHLVPSNFRLHVEAIDPDESVAIDRFRWSDDMRQDPDSSAGLIRTFVVRFDGSEPIDDLEDETDRWATVTYSLTMYYPIELEADTLARIIRKDRHDIIKALRDSDNFIGHAGEDLSGTAADSSADVGLQDRKFIDDSLEADDFTWVYTQKYECIEKETE